MAAYLEKLTGKPPCPSRAQQYMKIIWRIFKINRHAPLGHNNT